MGGNKRPKFVDGWVEFCDKKIAKRVALNLNGETIGGPKSNYWRDDIWTIKYLAKFKWHHLAESIAYQNRVADEKMRNEIAQAKRENSEYLDNVDKAARLEKMRERKRADGTALSQADQDKQASEAMERRFKQKKSKILPKNAQKAADKSELLSQVFGGPKAKKARKE